MKIFVMRCLSPLLSRVFLPLSHEGRTDGNREGRTDGSIQVLSWDGDRTTILHLGQRFLQNGCRGMQRLARGVAITTELLAVFH